MSNRSRRSAEDRAEARRRARYAAQGREEEPGWTDKEETDDPEASRPGGSFLSRLFPPAPPLPGKEDPLAEFRYDGPLRGLVAGLYVVARHPIPWLGMGTVWAVGWLLLEFGAIFGAIGSIIAIASSLAAFGALIAAGWIGWPRPWLFGLVASIAGILLLGVFTEAVATGAAAEFRRGEIFVGAIARQVVGFQPLFGALAGWYGGYLRRRMAQNVASPRATRSRRR